MKTKRRVLNKNKMQPRKSRKEMLKEARLTKNRRVGIGNIGKGKRFGFLNKRNLKKARKVAIVSAGVFGVFLLIGTVYAFSYLQSLNDELPTTEQVFPQVPIASEIYDRKALEGDGSSGTMLYRLINQDYNSDPVDIDEIPDYVKFAFIAAEDENFYGHNGFDAIAIARCAVYYVQDSNNLCGGSTITQQLVKITSLTNEVKLERKLKELILATKVEQANSKDEILQMYLQVAPFGSNVYGINTASNFYFRKDPKDLTLAEAAILASIVQNPTYLSPTKGIPDLETAQAAVKNRQMFVLGQLEENMERFNDQIRDNHDDQDMPDVLTKELIDEAKVQELSYASPVLSADIKAGHFVDYVVSQLTTRNYKYGEQPFTEEELRNGGYKIYTSLDYELQQIAERYAEVGGNSYKYLNVHNAAIMTTVPSTGEIITMAGSKSFTGDDEGCDANLQNCRYNPQVNVLTSLQSPGSTNKPLGYYLAFKSGKIFPGSMLPDVPIQIGGYVPKNWNSGFSGLKTNASEALRQSLNIPALHAIQLVGVDTYVNTAREWGYTSYGDDLGPSVILGGGSVYMTEHVQGYGVFANGGDLVKLDPIKKIVDKDGEVVYEAKPERKQVGDPQAIYQLTQSLKSYGQGVSFDGREWAGKTGTTENNEDTLYMIYTPDMVTVGWAVRHRTD